MQLDRHESNSRSKFSTSLDMNNINFLSNESLEVAIQSIKLDTSACNVIESSNGVPDIVLFHKKIPTSGLFDYIKADCNAFPFNKDAGIDYQTKSYLFSM